MAVYKTPLFSQFPVKRDRTKTNVRPLLYINFLCYLLFNCVNGLQYNFQISIQRWKRAKEHYTEDDNATVGDAYKLLLVVRMDLKMGKGNYNKTSIYHTLMYRKPPFTLCSFPLNFISYTHNMLCIYIDIAYWYLSLLRYQIVKCIQNCLPN